MLYRHGDPRQTPLVLLHGFLGSNQDWQPLCQSGQRHYYCLSLDLPGHGQAKFTGQADLDKLRSFADVGQWIIDIVQREIGARRFSLLGYSLGGRLALYLSLHYPQAIERLILESASPGIEDERQRQQRYQHDSSLLEGIDDDQKWREFLVEWYRQNIFAGVVGNANFPALLAERMRGDPAHIQRGMRLMSVGAQPDLLPDIGKLSCPTLFIAGAQDKKYRGLGEQLARQCSQIQLAIVKESSHMVHWQQPERFSELVRDFLAG